MGFFYSEFSFVSLGLVLVEAEESYSWIFLDHLFSILLLLEVCDPLCETVTAVSSQGSQWHKAAGRAGQDHILIWHSNDFTKLHH